MVTVTPKAVSKIREQFAKHGVQGGLRLGVLGGGCSGLSYHVQVRREAAPERHRLRFRRRQSFRRPEKHGLSERHDAGLEGLAHAVGLRVRQSEREEKLRLRNVFLGVTDYFELFGIPARA